MVLFGSFLLYVLTAAPMVTAGDCGELVSAAFTLGVAHPPGYPLSELAGKAVSFVPLGDVAFRMNVLSGAFISFAALTSYMLMGAMAGGDRPVHAAAALAAALCSDSWGLATSAEVYPLQILLSTLALYLLVRWHKGDGISFLHAGAFLAGLSAAAHYAALVYMPAFALVFALGIGREDRVRAGLVSAAFFVFGLSVFVYLAVRAAASPPLNWGRPDDLYAFFYHVSRAGYGDLGAFRMFSGAGAAATPATGAGSGATALAAVLVLAGVMLVLLKRSVGKTFRLLPAVIAAVTVLYLVKLGVKGISLPKVEYFAGLVWREHWSAVLPLAGFALYRQYRTGRDLFYAGSMLLACLTVVMIFRVPITPVDYALPLASKFFAPWFFLTAVFAGAGATSAAEMVKDARGSRLASGVLAVTAGAFALFLAATNYGKADSSRLYWPHDYSVDLMRTFDEDALFLSDGDHQPFLSIYQKTVEEARPDVTILEASGMVFDDYGHLSRVYRGPSQTVYCSQDPELDFYPGIKVRQVGIINWWDVGGKPAPDPVPFYTFRGTAEDAADAYFPDRSLYANFNYHMARRLTYMGEYRDAEPYMRKAIKVGGDLIWVRVNAGNLYNRWGMPGRAVEEYREALKLAPATVAAYLNLGDLYMTRGEYGPASEAFRAALKYAPTNPEARQRIEDIKRLETADFR